MNILIITPVIPYPLSEGGRISQYALIDALRKVCKIKLVLISSNNEDTADIEYLKSNWPDVDIRVILQYTDENESTTSKIISSGKKVLIRLLRYRKPQRDRNVYNPYILNLCNAKERDFIIQLKKIINEKPVDIIQCEFIEALDLALVFPNHIKKVFVHHELFYAKLESELKRTGHVKSEYDQYAISYAINREFNFLKLYDAIFTFSNDDKKKLEERLSKVKIFSSPFPILDKYFLPVNKDFEVKKLVFVGPEVHYPNKEAVEWYMEEISKLISSKKHLQLHVIGKWSDEFISKYKGNKSVVFTGFVDDLISYCKNSIMVVPVRIGSGIRSKILYAMAQSIPVVSTSLGCEGLDVTNFKSILIADTPEAFSNAVLRLADNRELAMSVAQEGYQMVSDTYSQKVLGNLRLKYYEEIIKVSKPSVENVDVLDQ